MYSGRKDRVLKILKNIRICFLLFGCCGCCFGCFCFFSVFCSGFFSDSAGAGVDGAGVDAFTFDKFPKGSEFKSEYNQSIIEIN